MYIHVESFEAQYLPLAFYFSDSQLARPHMAAAPLLRPMLSLAREETAFLSAELAAAGRVAVESAASGVKVAAEMNPLAVRQAAEASVKEGMGCEYAIWSCLSEAVSWYGSFRLTRCSGIIRREAGCGCCGKRGSEW